MTRPIPFPSPDSSYGCDVERQVAINTTEIAHLKETSVRVEGKIDKLLWVILCAAGTSTGTLLILLIKK
jgi:hypothetical protein